MTLPKPLLGVALFTLLSALAFAGFRYGPGLFKERAAPPGEAARTPTPQPLRRAEAEEIMDRRFQGGGLGVVVASALNVRSAPGLHGARQHLLRCGDVVHLGAATGGWYPVEAGAISGYSHGAYLFPLASGGSLPPCDERALRSERPAPTGPRVQAAPAVEIPPAPEPAPPPRPSAGSAQPSSPPRPLASPDAPPMAAPPKAAPPAAPRRGPTEIVLATHGGAKAVAFPHQAHNQMYGCAKCHHPLGEGAEAKTEKRCRSCHAGAEGQGSSPFTAREVLHKTCKGCHSTEAAGPQKCGECHTGT